MKLSLICSAIIIGTTALASGKSVFDTITERQNEFHENKGHLKEVVPQTPQGDFTKTSINGKHIWIKNRKNHLTQYPCTSCHASGTNLKASSSTEQRRSHWHLRLEHPSPEAGCQSCHSKKNPLKFKTFLDGLVGVNESHLLCKSCHQGEYKDWVNGAHGKRLAGWAGKRYSLPCTECHNPHSPGFATKVPETVFYLPRK